MNMKKNESKALLRLMQAFGLPVENELEAQEVLLAIGKNPNVSKEIDKLGALKQGIDAMQSPTNGAAIKAPVNSAMGICSECEDSHLTVYTWSVKMHTDDGIKNVLIPVKLCRKCGTMFAAFEHFESFVDSIMSLIGGTKLNA